MTFEGDGVLQIAQVYGWEFTALKDHKMEVS